MRAPASGPVRGALGIALLVAAWPVSVSGQVTITGSDFFNQAGQYFEAYAEKDTPVAGLLGSPGPTAQAWDFTSGGTNVVYRFDYLPVEEATEGATFPEAAIAERLTDGSSGVVKWLYFRQASGQGRLTYGFHDPDFSASQPTAMFTPPILDFPERIGFGDTWNTATEFLSEISLGLPADDEDGGGDFGIPTRVAYTSTAKADAFGLINQPGIGFGECLRVNELVQYDVSVDLGLGEGFMSVSTQYIRNYYWLRKGRGIAVQVTSRQLDTPPPEDFAVAAAMVRMFATNHADGVVDVPVITGFRITLGKEGALLQWSKAAGIARYRVEYATDGLGVWLPLVESTTANFHLDAEANKPDSPARFYRVIGLNN